MFVVRLSDGRLWLHTPIAPTEECLQLICSIPGEVAHIVLPNLSPEHWYYAPAFVREFPAASVWLCPGLMDGGGPPFPGKDDVKEIAKSHNLQVAPRRGSRHALAPACFTWSLQCAARKAVRTQCSFSLSDFQKSFLAGILAYRILQYEV